MHNLQIAMEPLESATGNTTVHPQKQLHEKRSHLQTNQLTGLLFILGAIGVFIPYTLLTISFDYPDILRQDAGVILTKFHEGGNQLIFTWWLFAILGLPMLVAYKQLGNTLENKSASVRWLTTVGIIGLVTQMIGLLRWTFVVPMLANNYYVGNDTTKEIAIAMFQLVHQYGGVVLGEHIGQLFTVIWTVFISFALVKQSVIAAWLGWFGYLSSAIYFIAQAEILETVIKGFPVWNVAGFLGSTFWLLWLILVGISLIKFSAKNKPV